MDTRWRNTYFNSYYYANIVNNILQKDIETIGFIAHFFDNEEAVFSIAKPFQKFSAFHQFIQHLLFEFIDNDMCEYDEVNFKSYLLNKDSKLPIFKKGFASYIDYPLKKYGFDFTFQEFIDDKKEVEYRDVEEYHDELSLTGLFEQLCEKISYEVFYLLFNNRDALLRFNWIMAEHLGDIDYSSIDDEEVKPLFKRNCTLKRVRIPEWCKKAVFFRDRGRCCLCGCDISGLLSTTSRKHYDHIIPLSQYGLNDVSNIQLLCSACNQGKSGDQIITSDFYENWY